MVYEIKEIGPETLPRYAEIPTAFRVKSVFTVDTVDHGLNGLSLVEKKVDPYTKDYDSQGDGRDRPVNWGKTFDISQWGFFLAIEGELSDKGLAALSETSDSMAKELAKMLTEKSESGENRSLRDIWAAYRKKEVQVEMTINKDISEPEPETETISKKEAHEPMPDIKMASSEVEKIGDRIVKVQFIEYTGKRKKKVTHIEVKEAELDEMMKKSDKSVHAQFALF